MGFSLNALVDDLQPYARALVQVASDNGLAPRVTSTRRSYEEQRQLYDRFLRGLSNYPVAPPGSSAHETGEAFDLVVTPLDYLPDLGALWRSWGGTWSPKDAVHFALPGAPSPELLAQLRPPQQPGLLEKTMTALSFTSLSGALLELGYIAASKEEAIRIADMLGIPVTDR